MGFILKHVIIYRALKATPNAGHLALAALMIPDILETVAPDAAFTLVTQNVDGLSTRASRIVAPKQEPELLEMHGRIFETICTACGHREANFDSPICPALGGTESTIESEEKEIALEDLPRCLKCHGLLRPGVVWFEETPHYMDEIQDLVNECDLALVIGTSSTVHKFSCSSTRLTIFTCKTYRFIQQPATRTTFSKTGGT